VDVKSASLSVYDKTEGNFTDTATGLPVVTSKGGPDYRAGGGVTTGIASATDQLGNPVGEPQNIVGQVTSFGGTNRWGVTGSGHGRWYRWRNWCSMTMQCPCHALEKYVVASINTPRWLRLRDNAMMAGSCCACPGTATHVG
jgi:hypothetical protein